MEGGDQGWEDGGGTGFGGRKSFLASFARQGGRNGRAHNSVGIGVSPYNSIGRRGGWFHNDRFVSRCVFVRGFGEALEGGEEIGDPLLGGLGLVGLEGGVLEVGAGGLEGVEKKSGAALTEASVEQTVDGLHECDLNGVGVFENRELHEVSGGEGVALETSAGAFALAGLVVEIAEAAMAECWAAARLSVDLYMLASRY